MQKNAFGGLNDAVRILQIHQYLNTASNFRYALLHFVVIHVVGT